jgi:hypothetical protein
MSFGQAIDSKQKNHIKWGGVALPYGAMSPP